MMITTRNLKEPKAAEPVKLKQITTDIIPNAVPRPESWQPKGDGFAKMITTHDEPKPKAPLVGGYLKGADIAILGESLKEGFAGIEETKKAAAGMGITIEPADVVPVAEPAPAPAAHKKSGRPKKTE